MATPDRDLGEARAAIDRGDTRGALKSLDSARKGYARALDSEGLEHVLDMAALVDASDDRIRIGRENLAYAAKQNLRQESRRRARQLGKGLDRSLPGPPGPDRAHRARAHPRCQALDRSRCPRRDRRDRRLRPRKRPGRHRPEDDRHAAATQQHRTDGHRSGVRRWDLPEPRGRAGRTETKVDANKLVQVFRLDQPGTDECLPLRVHDGYQAFGRPDALEATLSQATPCPGTTVLPRPGGSNGSTTL